MKRTLPSQGDSKETGIVSSKTWTEVVTPGPGQGLSCHPTFANRAGADSCSVKFSESPVFWQMRRRYILGFISLFFSAPLSVCGRPNPISSRTPSPPCPISLMPVHSCFTIKVTGVTLVNMTVQVSPGLVSARLVQHCHADRKVAGSVPCQGTYRVVGSALVRRCTRGSSSMFPFHIDACPPLSPSLPLSPTNKKPVGMSSG